MFEEMIKYMSIAFEQQFHLGCYYAYIRIKEQEINNIKLLAELIGSSNEKLKRGYALPFNY